MKGDGYYDCLNNNNNSYFLYILKGEKMKFKTKLKKAFISFLCSFTFMSVISFPKMIAKVNAQGLDINTAFQQIIGSHISENQWHYSFNGGQHFDEIISNTCLLYTSPSPRD